jgi:hypothetical protein
MFDRLFQTISVPPATCQSARSISDFDDDLLDDFETFHAAEEMEMLKLQIKAVLERSAQNDQMIGERDERIRELQKQMVTIKNDPSG